MGAYLVLEASQTAQTKRALYIYIYVPGFRVPGPPPPKGALPNLDSPRGLLQEPLGALRRFQEPKGPFEAS